MPVETMSTARMFRSDVCAWVSACFAASSVDVFELPTSSMIFTTAKASSFVGSRRCGLFLFYPLDGARNRPTPAAAADLPCGDPFLERGPLPGGSARRRRRGRAPCRR